MGVASNFEKENRGAYGGVERVGGSSHRDGDIRDFPLAPPLPQSMGLVPDDNRHAIGVRDRSIIDTRLRAGSENLDLASPQPRGEFRRGSDHERNGKQGPEASADGIRVPNLANRIADQYPRNPSGIRRSEDRAEIAGLFQPIQYEEQFSSTTGNTK